MPRPFIFAARISQADDKPVQIHAKLFFAAFTFAFSWGFTDNCRFGTSLELRLEFGFLDH